MSVYLRLLPLGGLTIPPFSYKEFVDLTEQEKYETLTEEVNRKTEDPDYQENRNWMQTLVDGQLPYTKKEVSHIYCLEGSVRVGSVFLSTILPPWPGMEGPKDFIVGACPYGQHRDFSRDFAHGIASILLWLFQNDKIDCIGAKFVLRKESGELLPSSRWCALHMPRIFPITEDRILVEDATRCLIVRITRKASVLAAAPTVPENWKWPTSEFNKGSDN